MSKLVRQLISDLKRHEGCDLKAYWDSIGRVWTIGYGHTKNVREGDRISQVEAEDLLIIDINHALNTVRSIVRNFDSLSFCRKTVLANMAFNLGTRLKEFKKMISAIEIEDFDRASLEMINSLWYVQVKSRGVELAKRMKSNTIEEKHIATS